MTMTAAQGGPSTELAAAMARHRAGDLAQAERGYRQVLAAQPDDAWATYLLGVVLMQRLGPAVNEALCLIDRYITSPDADAQTLAGIPDFIEGILSTERATKLQLLTTPAGGMQSIAERQERLIGLVASARTDAVRRTGGSPDEKTVFLHEMFQAINGGHDGLFFGDCMASVNKSRGFLADRKFMAAFERNAQHSTEENGRAWRLHTLAWAARHAMRLEGDFVECGVFEGFMSATLCDYLDFADSGRTFYLYDTFEGFSEKYSSREDFGVHHAFFDLAQNLYSRDGLHQSVVERFRPYPNVKVIRGVVPDSLLQDMPARVAYCHIDLNSPAAEVGALEVLFDRIVPGGVVVFDDYGWLPFAKQKEAEDIFAAQRGYDVLELPTGQGLLIKR